MRPAYVQKLKHPDGRALWGTYPVGRDEHGSWLFSPAGSVYRGERAGVVGWCEVGQGDRDRGRAVLHLVPTSGWWFAAWTAEPGHVTVSVDICTPPRRDGDTWSYVDLELDLFLGAAGSVRVDDTDEFEHACRRGHITEHERTRAIATTASLERQITARAAPFDDTGATRLRRSGALDLPPVTSLRLPGP